MPRPRLTLASALDLLSISAVVLLAIAGAVAWLRPLESDSRASRVSVEDVEPLPRGSIDVGEFFEMASAGRWVGPSSAPAVLMVYGNYTCGFCAEWYDTLALLRGRYPDHFAIVVKNIADIGSSRPSESLVPLGAECAADVGMFPDYHFAAYRLSGVLDYTDATLRLAQAAGVTDLEEFGLCIRSAKYRGRLTENAREAERLDILGTPTSFLNGRRINGALPLDVIDRLVVLQFPGRPETEARRMSLD